MIDTWPDPAGLLERIEGIGYKDHIARKQAFPERLVAFGYGDGGGGPQFEMIEAARRLQDLEELPQGGIYLCRCLCAKAGSRRPHPARV